jgi:uncharacterized membrane-anchored protein
MATSEFSEHPLRQFALGEIHARPFQAIATPRRIFHYAFTSDREGAERDRKQLQERCRQLGVTAPSDTQSHHVVTIGSTRLRWELHSEFVTYTWDSEPGPDVEPPSFDDLLGGPFRQPGPMIVATRLDLVKERGDIGEMLRDLDPGTTAVSSLRGGRAIGATDFRADDRGLTRMLLIDRSLYKHEVGPIVIRLMELETYRTMALLGLPEAHRLQPLIARAEIGLQDATTKIGQNSDLTRNRALLEDLTSLASDLEAAAARSSFRFGATRAYSEIVASRLSAIREEPLEGYTRWSSFLQRRLAPAMRTCQGIEARLGELSDRLARAANLLRTRIEVDLEQQNRELLASMNSRARLQLRLQQWVEGLSVAAVSYYVVSLVYYLANGADSFGLGVDPARITAFAVPPVVVGIWLFVRRVRARGHAAERESEAENP